MSAPAEQHKREAAVILGYLEAMHQVAKLWDEAGIEEADMIACAIEDLFTMVEPILSADPVKAMAVNG